MKVQRFGSTESRSGTLTRDIRAPFTNTRSQGPGPGRYGEKRTSFQFRPQKKLTDEVVGFSSTQTRPCLKEAHSPAGGGAV